MKNDDIEQFREYFLNKENPINSYYNKYKSYEMDFLINENSISLSYTKYGIIEIKSSALEQSLEIVRRRIDETGTKEPTIIRRGNDRILIELPGLDDPNRIKNLLGKTANLTFRIISDEDKNFGSELIFYPEENRKISVNKRGEIRKYALETFSWINIIENQYLKNIRELFMYLGFIN